jgi:phytoene synthase
VTDTPTAPAWIRVAIGNDLAVREQSRQVLRAHARSFSWASLFLPRAQRDDAAVVYALCRAVDDTVDRATNAEQAQQALEEIERDLERERPLLPLVAEFVRVASRRGMSLEWAGRLIEGVLSDTGRVRMADDAQLLRYCYDVAGTVGLMMSALMGVRHPRAAAHAIDLGIAMQLTNICRDVLEDAQKDRVYLPASRLPYGIVGQQRIVDGQADADTVSRTVRELLALADSYYESGSLGLRYIPPRPRLAIGIASRLYRAIGQRLLRRCNGNPLQGRVVVPRREKLLLVARAAADWLLSLVGVPGPVQHREELHFHLNGLPGVAARTTSPVKALAVFPRLPGKEVAS